MKTALLVLALFSCVFSKQENQNEDIVAEANKINYPGQCSSTFKSGTEFDIEYNKTEGVNGTATIKLSLDEVEAICTFTEEKGTCTTQKDVETDGELKLDVPDNLIEVKQDDITNSKVNIEKANKKNEKYNKKYVDLSKDLNQSQNFVFVNETKEIKSEDGLKIPLAQKSEVLLNVYKGKDKKDKLNCTLIDNKTEIQCALNLTMFPLNEKNDTDKTYEIFVENVCGDLYEKSININVKWSSSHYVKALGLLTVLLVFIL